MSIYLSIYAFVCAKSFKTCGGKRGCESKAEIGQPNRVYLAFNSGLICRFAAHRLWGQGRTRSSALAGKTVAAS
jgi:hypothetical protein